jgi:hypothetical protein
MTFELDYVPKSNHRIPASPTALLMALFLVALQPLAVAQTSQVQVLVGTVNPRVACSSDPAESYALYLPPGFSTNRDWPILYFFDPFARGQVAAEVIKAAAAKYGYIIAASNNSKNGPMGGSKEAAIAMWDDTHARLPVNTHRRYVAGLSGGPAPSNQPTICWPRSVNTSRPRATLAVWPISATRRPRSPNWRKARR